MAYVKAREEELYQAVLDGELEIDSEGRIWRAAFRTGDSNHGGVRLIHCERRRAENNAGAYLQIRVMYNWHRVHAGAHRLVYRHFHGPIPAGMTVNHKNGQKKDNRPCNLELATPSAQAIHSLHVLKHGRLERWGSHSASAKLTEEQVAQIRERREQGEKLLSIAKDFGVAFQTVSKIARRERWSHG